MITATNTAVAPQLSRQSLLQLAAREVGAIHVKNFYPAEIGKQVAQQAYNHPQLGHYHKKYTSSVGRICIPHIDTESDPEIAEQYYQHAAENIAAIRSLFTPYLAPVDHMRLLLQELWPAGANVQQIYGRSCFAGAIRVFEPKRSEFFPHNDRIDFETEAPEVRDVTEQLVANIYLEVPDRGGDLLLWLRDPTPREHQIIRDVEGLSSDSVEPPALTIHPGAGDLIIFSSRMLHAVTPCATGYRVGMALFIACRAPHLPLTFWS
jgi:carrier-protein-independent halogenase WelO5-like protein